MENYFRILTEIKNAVTCNDVNAFKTLSTLLNHVNTYENYETIWNYQQNAYENLGDINLICLACKSESEEVLEYLLTSGNCVYSLPYAIHRSSLVPEFEDEESHNAFYYAIRTNVCNLVEILICKWPNDIFKGNSNRLDEILAEALKDLFLRNVCLSKDMEIYIQNKLMDLRFFDDTLTEPNAVLRHVDVQHLRNLATLRLEFLIKTIALVKDQIRKSEPDELILLSLKYIAKNIHMLKASIVSSIKLPWEEIVFCLVTYIRLCSNHFKKDPLYQFVLDKKRISTHLEYFSDILFAVKEKLKTAKVNKTRKLVLKESFADRNIEYSHELHDDFTLVRDLHSLVTIKNSIDLAMTADASQKEGQLIITRALQIIGEHLKNTKDSPKLSEATNQLLHSALPLDLKKTVTELRDSLSHAESSCLRSEIEESGQYFFTSMQSDINQMSLIVNEIIYEKKSTIIRTTMAKFKDFNSLKLYLKESFSSPSILLKELEEASNFSMGYIEQVEKLVGSVQTENERDLRRFKNLFRRIYDVPRENDSSASPGWSESMTLPDISKNDSIVRRLFESMLKLQQFQRKKIHTFLQDELILKKIEITKSALLMLKTFSVSSDFEQLLFALEKFDKTNLINEENLKECKKLLSDWEASFDRTANFRREKLETFKLLIHEEKARVKTFQKLYKEAMKKLIHTAYDVMEGYNNLSIDETSSKTTFNLFLETDVFFKSANALYSVFIQQAMNEDSLILKERPFHCAVVNLGNFLNIHMGKIKWIKEFQRCLEGNHKIQVRRLSKDAYKLNDQLKIKICSLKNFLNDNHLNVGSSENMKVSEKHAKLRSVIEMLVLDITECLSGHFTHNSFFLDDDYPLTNGKNLRNHLAHANSLIDILFGDDFTNLLLYAGAIVEKYLLKSNRKIGKKVKNDPRKSYGSHLKDLKAVKQQLALFSALSMGSMEEVENCVRNGADLKGRSLNSWTALHFAAKGPNLELVKLAIKFIPDANAKDANLQTALHIASTHGRFDTVQYLVKKIKLEINAMDIDEKTALHLASQKGHLNIVEFLLKHNADPIFEDIFQYTAVHYAVEENYADVVAILLEKEPSVEEKLTCSGLSALRIAALKGHLNLVVTLMENKGNINTERDVQFTSLHFASVGGNAEVVKYLIVRGADVSAKDKNGVTSLHLAIEKDHDEIADILLENGADVNAFDNEFWTPLSIAAKRGNLQMLKLLLERGASVNYVTNLGNEPLEIAARFGHYAIVKSLLYDCNIDSKLGAFRGAAEKGFKRIVELFIKDGVDDKALCSLGMKLTAMHCAARAGHTDIVNILIENGYDINAISECEEEQEDFGPWKIIFPDPMPVLDTAFEDFVKHIPRPMSCHGLTPLHMGCRAGQKSVVRCLIRNGADITIKDRHNWTALQSMIFQDMTDILIDENVPVRISECDEFNPLRCGVRNNDLKFVKYCLRENCDINKKGQSSDETILQSAIEFGSAEMIEYLLENGADINVKNEFNCTVLELSVFENRKDVVNILTERKGGINAKAERQLFLIALQAGHEDMVEYFLKRDPKNGLANIEYSEYPLHVAVTYGHRNVLQILLEATEGCGINDNDETGITPLVLAVNLDNCEIVQLLLSKGADPKIKTSRGVLPLHMAISKGSIEIVKILIKAKTNVYLRDNSCNSALKLAAMSQNLDIFKILLENSEVDINFSGQEGQGLLWKAITSGHLPTVNYLVEKGVSVKSQDSQGHNVMYIAANSGHQHIVEYFLRLALHFNDRMKPHIFVHFAAEGNCPELCEFLYEKGFDLNAFDANGCPPLSVAFQNGNIEVFNALLHFGSYYDAIYEGKEIQCDVLSVDQFVMLVSLTLISHLFSAVRNNDVSKTEALLSTSLTFSKYGYSNVRNAKNISLLHYAAWKGHDDIVDLLLKYKANPNAANKVNPETGTQKAFSPLHYASKYSHIGIVKALLCHGAVFNAMCGSGKTPLDFATDPEIKDIFCSLEMIFAKIQNGGTTFMILKHIQDSDSVKAVMGATNLNGRTVTELAAERNHFETTFLQDISKKILKI